MPKLVDYASRYEFLRRAAFALVLEEGAQAPTRRAVAARLGCGLNTVCRLVDPSVDLAVLAADEVRTRRRAGRWGRLPEDPAEAARILARRLLPEDESRIDEELVWLRLTGAHAGMGRRRESPLALRHDFQVAERGWSDVTRPAPPPESDTGAAPLARHFAERRAEVDSVIDRVLDLLDVPEREAEKTRLAALADGLTLAVCLGRITPGECVQAMERHLVGLRQPPG